MTGKLELPTKALDIRPPHPPPFLSLPVIIVNCPTPDLTGECLRSFASEIALLPGTSPVVVDTASGDGSIDAVRSALAPPGGCCEQQGRWGDEEKEAIVWRSTGMAGGPKASVEAVTTLRIKGNDQPRMGIPIRKESEGCWSEPVTC